VSDAMSEPKHDAGDQQAGMVVVASLVEARAVGTELLETVDASFDYVASLVCLCIVADPLVRQRPFFRLGMTLPWSRRGARCLDVRGIQCGAVPVAVCRPTGSGGVARIAALYARAMSSGFATKAGRSRRFGRNPKPDFSGDFHPASREIKQERRST